ncbi:MAG: DUF2851 family protein, partial [Planctomycetes bacterium]|nr:DUF2851 family protein [Planctomycetota bacterium]
MPASDTEFGEFSGLYQRLQNRFSEQLGEKEPLYGEAGRGIREEVVCCIWFGGHFPPEGLSADDGRRLEVLSPGWWNVEGGPDFVRAEFILEGKGRVVGDVEVHTLSSSWYAHGHHRQPEYNDVALHVVLWDDQRAGGKRVIRSEDGSAVPQLILSDFIEEDLEELVELIGPEDEQPREEAVMAEGRYCGRAYAEGKMAPEWLGRLLDAAGDYRVLSRASAFADLFKNHSREQLFYERLAEALGYKNNRMPFIQLAGLLPVKSLRRIVPVDEEFEGRAILLEALFFGVAGFLPQGEVGRFDPETARYVEQLQGAWERLGRVPTDVRLSRNHWKFAGARPVNYPPRRITALARLYARHLHDGVFARLVRLVATTRPEGRRRADVALREALVNLLRRLEHPYWSCHYTLGGKRLAKAKALVGRQRATSILVDVALPMLVAHARQQDDSQTIGRLHQLWKRMPRRPDNTITRRMGQVMFGGAGESRKVVTSACRQQGLHQIYRDFCRTSRGCRQCVVYLAHQAEESLL